MKKILVLILCLQAICQQAASFGSPVGEPIEKVFVFDCEGVKIISKFTPEGNLSFYLDDEKGWFALLVVDGETKVQIDFERDGKPDLELATPFPPLRVDGCGLYRILAPSLRR